MQYAEHFQSECEKLESLREVFKQFSQLNIFFICVSSVIAVLNSHETTLHSGKITFSFWWISQYPGLTMNWKSNNQVKF